MSSKKRKLIGIDLFCGAGGLSLGFEQAGVNVVAAVDVDPINTEIHRINFPDCVTICEDITKLTGESIREKAKIRSKEIDVVFGGPPCQSFSLIGKRNTSDPRAKLLHEFARIVIELKPRYFVMENVKGLTLGATKVILEAFVETLEKAGYNIVKPIRVLNAANFGVPQKRERVFVLGYKEGEKAIDYPKAQESEPPTVWDAIQDLPKIENHEYLLESDKYEGKLGKPSEYAKALRGDERKPLTGCLRTVHTKETVKRFKATEQGKQEPISRFYRLKKTGVSNTLRAGTGKANGSYTAARPIHPVSPRCITVREAARLHSYPDWFRFHATRWHGFKQIGNSVPPLMAQNVAKALF